MTVTGAVKKSLFEYLVQCGSDEADETPKTVRFKVIDSFQYIKIQLRGDSERTETKEIHVKWAYLFISLVCVSRPEFQLSN